MELKSIMALDERYYMNTFGKRVPVAFSLGKGAVLTATDGTEYLDFMAGIAVCSLGHCNERVTEALVSQAQRLVHTSSVYYIENQAVLAKMLCEAVKMDRVFFTSSGSEANEGMYKLARCYFSRRGESKWEVISAKRSFHGRTLANTAATGQPRYQEPYLPLPQGFINVEYNSLEAIEKAITPNTAAVILETIQAEGGVIEGNRDYLKGVQNLCHEKGILFMLDEVQVGLGRTGEMTSYASLGLSPDIISVAKTLGNGFPIGLRVQARRPRRNVCRQSSWLRGGNSRYDGAYENRCAFKRKGCRRLHEALPAGACAEAFLHSRCKGQRAAAWGRA